MYFSLSNHITIGKIDNANVLITSKGSDKSCSFQWGFKVCNTDPEIFINGKLNTNTDLIVSLYIKNQNSYKKILNLGVINFITEKEILYIDQSIYTKYTLDDLYIGINHTSSGIYTLELYNPSTVSESTVSDETPVEQVDSVIPLHLKSIPVEQPSPPSNSSYKYISPVLQSEKGQKGERGDKGTDGLKGERGAPGKDGIGIQGLQGKVGEKGERGEKGATGIKGDRGTDGLKGDRGEKGEIGAQGDKGERGETGLTGPAGARGPTGIHGQKGESGSVGQRGEKGEIGMTGPQGEKGETGTVGPQGLKGDTGSVGPQGEKGEIGMTGPQGPKGDRGLKGELGERGPIGLVGEKGVMGERGEQGEKGIQGCKGDRGEKGINGIQGIQGEKGDSGETGIQGLKGERGEKGNIGLRGEKGDRGETGIQGIQGTPGEKGDRGLKGDIGENGLQGSKGDRGEKGDIGERGPVGFAGEKGMKGEHGPRGEEGIRGINGMPAVIKRSFKSLVQFQQHLKTIKEIDTNTYYLIDNQTIPEHGNLYVYDAVLIGEIILNVNSIEPASKLILSESGTKIIAVVQTKNNIWKLNISIENRIDRLSVYSKWDNINEQLAANGITCIQKTMVKDPFTVIGSICGPAGKMGENGEKGEVGKMGRSIIGLSIEYIGKYADKVQLISNRISHNSLFFQIDTTPQAPSGFYLYQNRGGTHTWLLLQEISIDKQIMQWLNDIENNPESEAIPTILSIIHSAEKRVQLKSLEIEKELESNTKELQNMGKQQIKFVQSVELNMNTMTDTIKEVSLKVNKCETDISNAKDSFKSDVQSINLKMNYFAQNLDKYRLNSSDEIENIHKLYLPLTFKDSVEASVESIKYNYDVLVKKNAVFEKGIQEFNSDYIQFKSGCTVEMNKIKHYLDDRSEYDMQINSKFLMLDKDIFSIYEKTNIIEKTLENDSIDKNVFKNFIEQNNETVVELKGKIENLEGAFERQVELMNVISTEQFEKTYQNLHSEMSVKIKSFSDILNSHTTSIAGIEKTQNQLISSTKDLFNIYNQNLNSVENQIKSISNDYEVHKQKVEAKYQKLVQYLSDDKRNNEDVVYLKQSVDKIGDVIDVLNQSLSETLAKKDFIKFKQNCEFNLETLKEHFADSEAKISNIFELQRKYKLPIQNQEAVEINYLKTTVNTQSDFTNDNVLELSMKKKTRIEMISVPLKIAIEEIAKVASTIDICLTVLHKNSRSKIYTYEKKLDISKLPEYGKITKIWHVDKNTNKLVCKTDPEIMAINGKYVFENSNVVYVEFLLYYEMMIELIEKEVYWIHLTSTDGENYNEFISWGELENINQVSECGLYESCSGHIINSTASNFYKKVTVFAHSIVLKKESIVFEEKKVFYNYRNEWEYYNSRLKLCDSSIDFKSGDSYKSLCIENGELSLSGKDSIEKVVTVHRKHLNTLPSKAQLEQMPRVDVIELLKQIIFILKGE